MNEPLTNSRPGISFTGKTYNNHPQWSNQPLRLTKEQKKDPVLVIDDFFQCYHLKDVRALLWNWVYEIVSNPNDISSEPRERGNHLYFYEKIEEIIEAIFIIRSKVHKRRRRKEKRKLKQQKKSASPTIVHPMNEVQANQLVHPNEPTGPVNLFNKEKRLNEYVNEDPFYVIREILRPGHWSFIVYAIRDWLLIALSVDNTTYDDGDHRQNLITFHDNLLLLVEAIFIILIHNTEESDFKENLKRLYRISLLNDDQKTNPTEVISAFFEKYSPIYVQRELDDWLDAAIYNNAGPWRDNITCALHVLETYRNVLCLIKSAKQLLNRQEFQTKA